MDDTTFIGLEIWENGQKSKDFDPCQWVSDGFCLLLNIFYKDGNRFHAILLKLKRQQR